MSASKRLRCVAGVLLASALVDGCRGRMERPGGGSSKQPGGQSDPPASQPAGQSDPRATGQSEFGGIPPTAGPATVPVTNPTVANESPPGIEPGTVRVGDRVLALSAQRAEVLDVRDRDNPSVVEVRSSRGPMAARHEWGVEVADLDLP